MRLPIALGPLLLVVASAAALISHEAGPYREAPEGIAAKLFGGADCANYRTAPCGKGDTKCPATITWGTYTGSGKATRGKASNTTWCGCVTNCTNTKAVKGLVTCGS